MLTSVTSLFKTTQFTGNQILAARETSSKSHLESQLIELLANSHPNPLHMLVHWKCLRVWNSNTQQVLIIQWSRCASMAPKKEQLVQWSIVFTLKTEGWWTICTRVICSQRQSWLTCIDTINLNRAQVLKRWTMTSSGSKSESKKSKLTLDWVSIALLRYPNYSLCSRCNSSTKQ